MKNLYATIRALTLEDIELITEYKVGELSDINLREIRFEKDSGYYKNLIDKSCDIITYSPGLKKYGCFPTLQEYETHMCEKKRALDPGTYDLEIVFDEEPQKIILVIPELIMHLTKKIISEFTEQVLSHITSNTAYSTYIGYSGDMEIVFSNVIMPNAFFIRHIINSVLCKNISKGLRMALCETKELYSARGGIKSSTYLSSFVSEESSLFNADKHKHKELINSYISFLKMFPPQWYINGESIKIDSLLEDFLDLYDCRNHKTIKTSFKRYFPRMFGGYKNQGGLLQKYRI